MDSAKHGCGQLRAKEGRVCRPPAQLHDDKVVVDRVKKKLEIIQNDNRTKGGFGSDGAHLHMQKGGEEMAHGAKEPQTNCGSLF